MPRNIVTEMAPMIASVCAAFFARGWRNAGTPSEIASTPGERRGTGRERVQDHEQPDRRGRLSRARGPASSCSATTGQPPNMHLPIPTIRSVKIETMNAYVGTAKSVPDSGPRAGSSA